MRIWRNRIVLVIVLVLALALSACSDKNLETLAKALNDTAQGVAVLQTVVIDAERQQLISRDVTRNILEFSIKINQAGQDAVMITRTLDSLEEPDRQKLLTILMPIINQLADTQTLANAVPDANVRQKVLGAMSLIQASVNSAQLILAATN